MRRDLRALLGSLLIVPALTLAWGATWSWPAALDQRWAIPLVWAAYAQLRTGDARRFAPAARALDGWRRFDPWIAATFAYAVLFRFPETALVPASIWLALSAAFFGLRRLPGPALVALGAAVLIFGVALPRGLQTLLVARVAQSYDLTVDHRLKPDGGEINSHGARFRGEPADLADDDFVVLFLGDSFTFGFNLFYADSYPYRVEARAAEARCEARVRAVNMGWTSSSPLLALRLLREVGFEYRPDLVVYNLDMTDFHDDLRYERALRRAEQFDFDPAAVVERLVVGRAPWATGLVRAVAPVTARLRSNDRSARALRFAGLDFPGPADRYFVTEHPLARSVPGIEHGVMKNLADMDVLAREGFGAEMAVVVYPRAYQYSQVESPDNWEADRYQRMGPYSQEPFRYFREREAELPYAVIDLLPDFEATDAFPLYFRQDPHWNKRGAAFAADAVFAHLVERGLVPCRAER